MSSATLIEDSEARFGTARAAPRWAHALLAACALWPAGALAQTPRALRVLFVGNSHTYTHDVPALVELLAASAPSDRPRIATSSVTIPGACLEVHWRDGRARAAIATGRFDVVVLQECGGGIGRQRGRYYRYARLFDAAVRASGARTVLAMVHSYRAGGNGSTEVIAASVRALARELGASVAPDAIAWQALRRDVRGIDLFEADGYHPNLAGAYLDAATTYATLVCASPADLSRSTPDGTVPLDLAQRIWRLAWASAQREPAGCSSASGRRRAVQ